MKDSHIENILNDILSELKSIRKQNRCWMGIDEVSDYIGLKTSTIYQYVNQNKIPFRKIPGSSKLIFSRESIDEWIEKGSALAVPSTRAIKEANRIWGNIQEKHF